MDHSKRISFSSRVKSFQYAFAGVKTLFKSEPNARIHLVSAVVAIALGAFCQLDASEWLFVVLAIVLVFAAELFNTALETLANFVQPERHEAIKKVKDLAAGAVLMISIGAFVGGLIIFVPKLIHICS